MEAIWKRRRWDPRCAGRAAASAAALWSVALVAPADGQVGGAEPAATPTATGRGAAPISAFELGYSVRNWTIDEGLPSNWITALAQTPDGYLWVGTDHGLSRFNGFEFKEIEIPPLGEGDGEGEGATGIVALVSDRAGRLWVSAEAGRLLLFESGRLTEFGEANGFPPRPAIQWRVTESPEGEIVVIGANRDTNVRARYEPGTGLPPGRPAGRLIAGSQSPAPTAGYPPSRPVITGSGTEFNASISGEFWRWDDGRFAPAAPGDSKTSFPFFGRDGEVLVADGTGVHRWNGSGWEKSRHFSTPDGAPSTLISNWWDCLEDENGNFWMGTTNDGLVICSLDGALQRLSLRDANFPSNCHHLLVDRQGSIWAGSSSGVFQFYRSPFLTIPLGDRSQDSLARVVVEDEEGRVWIGSPRGIEYFDSSGVIRSAPVPDDTRDYWAVAPLQDRGGVVAASRSVHVWEQSTGAYGQPVASIDSLHAIVDVAHSQEGEVIIATDASQLYSWTPGRGEVAAEIGGPKPLPAAPATLVDTGPDGAIYIAQATSGFWRRAAGGWVELHRLSLDEHGPLTHFDIAPDGAAWFVFGNERVACWDDGSWIALGAMPGGPVDQGPMVVDRIGGLWVASQFDGVRWVDAAGLLGWAGGSPPASAAPSFRNFDRADGLGSKSCSRMRRGIALGSDGRVWVANAAGLSVIDPRTSPGPGSDRSKVPVRIESVLVDDAVQPPPQTGGEFVVPPSSGRVEFHFVGLDLLNPANVRYRYRLNGLDTRWIDAGNQRTANYHELPPGAYEFTVSTGPDGNTATAPVVVLPAWWQRAWVPALGAALLLGLTLYGFNRRIAEARRRHAEAQEFSGKLIRSQEDERKRIAVDLHDSIGQDLLVIKNRLLMAKTQLAEGGKPDRELDEMIQVASEAVQEVRDVSHNLHPYKLERLGLTKAIQSTVRQVSETAGLEIALDVDPVDRLFRKSDEISVYRIVQECLSNVVKHSGASRASVEILRGGNEVQLRVTDDGVGLPAEAARAGRGLGLEGIAERTRMLRGSFTISAPPGRGTTIAFRFPVAMVGE